MTLSRGTGHALERSAPGGWSVCRQDTRTASCSAVMPAACFYVTEDEFVTALDIRAVLLRLYCVALLQS